MNSKKIAAIVVFTALSISLVMSPLKFPAPYAPFLKYQIWEIPLVAAFLLFGSLAGVMTVIMNTTILLAVYPGDLPTGPLYNLAAVLSMLLGIFLTQIFLSKYKKKDGENILIVISTIIGSIARVVTMWVINWVFLPYPYPIGFSIPREALSPLLPLIGLFNATVTLYTIPLGYIIYRAVRLNTNVFS